jgi:hypothetical protein
MKLSLEQPILAVKKLGFVLVAELASRGALVV